MGLFGSKAKAAGRKAAKSWQNILDQSGDDIEDLTGNDLYGQACEDARNWIRSRYYNATFRRIDGQRPERSNHREFLDYVDGFMAAFPPRTNGRPKD